MKTAIIIPCYNRPEYLKKCLDSIYNTYLPKETLIYITDDASTNKETIQLIKKFYKDCQIKKVFNKINNGINIQLLNGYKYCFDNNYDYVIVLDSDAIVNNYFYDLMCYTHNIFPNKTISGFNTLNKNEYGNIRHQIQFDGKWYKLKNTCGALCIGMNKNVYDKYVHNILLIKKENNIKQNFDNKFTSIASQESPHVVCTVPSVAEHIGIDNSTLGHNINPDISCDFMHYVELPYNMKITVNMATYPLREKIAKRIIENLITFNIIEKIRIYLNEYDKVPDWCKHKKIEYLIGGENLKDTGKFYWAGTYKNEYYFTIDDDLLYPEEYFKKHIELLNKYNSNIFVSLHGKVLQEQPKSFTDLKEKYHYLEKCTDNKWINFPGTGVMVFDNSKYKIPLELFKYHGMTDLWIAYYLQVNKIKCLLRSHENNEVKYIHLTKDTLWNKQKELYPYHEKILQLIPKWELLKEEEENNKKLIKRARFIKQFSIYEIGKEYDLKSDWATIMIMKGRAVQI